MYAIIIHISERKIYMCVIDNNKLYVEISEL